VQVEVRLRRSRQQEAQKRPEREQCRAHAHWSRSLHARRAFSLCCGGLSVPALLVATPAVEVRAGRDGATLVTVAYRPYTIAGTNSELVAWLITEARAGIAQADLIERSSPRWERLAVLKTIRALIAVAALVVREWSPESDAAPRLAEFELVPRHCGTWEGDWMVFDPEGALLERFSATLVSELIENQWVNRLEQRHADGSVERQEFVGEVLGPGVLELRSKTPQMAGFRLLLREIAHAFLLVELCDRTTGTLRGVELVTLAAENMRLRTMQSFAADGSFQGTLTIVERRTPRS
jgi:hypothetical protein